MKRKKKKETITVNKYFIAGALLLLPHTASNNPTPAVTNEAFHILAPSITIKTMSRMLDHLILNIKVMSYEIK